MAVRTSSPPTEPDREFPTGRTRLAAHRCWAARAPIEDDQALCLGTRADNLDTILVFDALGTQVWTTELPGTTGSDTVELAYAGPALVPGMYYQFRVTSWREVKGERLDISRSEDLRGVFFHGQAPAEPECVAETDGASSSATGGESTN